MSKAIAKRQGKAPAPGSAAALEGLGERAVNIVRLYRGSRAHAAAAVIMALKGGAELLELKEEVGNRGGFVEIVRDRLGIPHSTALNHMRLARATVEALRPIIATVTIKDVTDMVEELTEARRGSKAAKLFKAVEDVIAGRSLTEVYSGFGIGGKAPKALPAPAAAPASPAEVEERAKELASQAWTRITRAIRNELEDGSLAMLSATERAAIEATLRDGLEAAK